MEILSSGLGYFDLNFLGVSRIIATVVLHGPGGAALIDPGPSSTLPMLRAGLSKSGLEVGDLNHRAVAVTVWEAHQKIAERRDARLRRRLGELRADAGERGQGDLEGTRTRPVDRRPPQLGF